MEWPWNGEAATLDWATDYPLHDAAERGAEDEVRSLLSQGADPHLQEPQRNWVPIQYAAACGHAHACEVLLAAGASLLDDSCAPLQLAFNSGSFAACQVLLAQLKARGHLTESGRSLFEQGSCGPSAPKVPLAVRNASHAPASRGPPPSFAPSRVKSSPAHALSLIHI